MQKKVFNTTSIANFGKNQFSFIPLCILSSWFRKEFEIDNVGEYDIIPESFREDGGDLTGDTEVEGTLSELKISASSTFSQRGVLSD